MMSALTAKFDLYWRGLNGLPLEREHRFHPTRKWRFDRANIAARVAIELDGGAYSFGRHVRGAGFEKDCEKLNEAALAGWVVFRLTNALITVPTLERIAEFIRNR